MRKSNRMKQLEDDQKKKMDQLKQKQAAKLGSANKDDQEQILKDSLAEQVSQAEQDRLEKALLAEKDEQEAAAAPTALEFKVELPDEVQKQQHLYLYSEAQHKEFFSVIVSVSVTASVLWWQRHGKRVF